MAKKEKQRSTKHYT